MTRKALVLMHHPEEGPGTLADFLREDGVELTLARMYQGEKIPAGPFDLVVAMGGDMNVYEEEEYPFLTGETEYIKKSLDNGTVVLGICLGAQLLAKAAGSKVMKSPRSEYGWGRVDITEAGILAPLFKDCPPSLDVLQWHEDTFEVPVGGELLAVSRECTNQAFRYGSGYGLQFHIEVDSAIIESWFADRDDRDEVLKKFQRIQSDYSQRARSVYANLLSMVRENGAVGKTDIVS